MTIHKGNTGRLVRYAASLPPGWVKDRPGVKYSLVHVDVYQGLWTTKVLFEPGAVVPTHLHTGPVIGFTIRGSWGYPAEGVLFKTGDYCLEVAGTYHRVEVPKSNTDETEAIFLLWGALIILDEGTKKILEYSDAANIEQQYLELCRQQDVAPASYIKID